MKKIEIYNQEQFDSLFEETEVGVGARAKKQQEVFIVGKLDEIYGWHSGLQISIIENAEVERVNATIFSIEDNAHIGTIGGLSLVSTLLGSVKIDNMEDSAHIRFTSSTPFRIGTMKDTSSIGVLGEIVHDDDERRPEIDTMAGYSLIKFAIFGDIQTMMEQSTAILIKDGVSVGRIKDHAKVIFRN